MPQDIRALSGISKLHEDILLELFRLCHDTDVPHAVSWNGTNLRYDLGWVRLRHVSSLWRRILLVTSFLWADLVCALPPAEDVAVARARECPLILDDDLDLPPDMSPEDAYAFRDRSIKNISSAPYLSRSLRIAQRMGGCDWTHVLSSLSFPDLRDLRIIQNPPHPPNPVLINAPELQVVSLNHFPATFTAKNIRQLSLFGGDELQLGSSWKLIETLDALPLLEHVTLVFFPTHPVEWCGSDAPRAHLNHFTSIRLMVTLWHRIDCPRSVVFDADLLDWRNEGWRSYVNTFAPLLSGRQDSRVLEINLSPFDDELHHMSFSTHRSPL
ncbi:hypothetical protein PENSPDRAFT_688632 [Peniophora sp. CONT]|nr:hypothetical protein PENSPDRAFT_688632 [Peniophora sp. CONT]